MSSRKPGSKGEVVDMDDRLLLARHLRGDPAASAALVDAYGGRVLTTRAMVQVEVTRGTAARLSLDLPDEVQVNKVASADGAVSDWRVSEGRRGRVLTVFLDRQISGEFRFDVEYERLLPGRGDGQQAEAVAMPLLWARDVSRQRGMVSLLATKDLALSPRDEQDVTRVGENQLPAVVRNRIERKVAHTFKYRDANPGLTVAPSVPDKEEGRFGAVVDTLISLGDVTMKGGATVAIDVKSGVLPTLSLALPTGVNLSSLTAPSLREYDVEEDAALGGGQRVDLVFTQDMEGSFRIDVDYEKILGDAPGEVVVPTLRVLGAEVEQGRVAVEALAAVEVRVAEARGLSTLDTAELPQQLVLRTTNPILLAYTYVQIDPPYALTLGLSRHQEIEVQAGAIDEAVYRTLYTGDGLAVTTARYTMRNTREQFLRVRLPAGAEVWSATVDGRSEKPALASDDGSGREVLIKIINATKPFVVAYTFATPAPVMTGFGRVKGMLPRPDVVATSSRWEVFVPDGLRYGEPSGDLRLVSPLSPVG